MRTSSAKAKGRRLQDEVVALLKRMFGFGDDDVRPAIMGETGADVKLLSAWARETFPFAMECKNVERLNLWGALAQTEANCPARHTPMLIFRRNRSKTYAVVELEKLLPHLK